MTHRTALKSPSSEAATNKEPDFDIEIARFTPRQMEAVFLLDSGLIKFLLYGGALGGGKSYFLRWYCVRRLIVLNKLFGLEAPVAMLACEDYPSLKDRQLSKIGREFPPWLGQLKEDHKTYGRCFILNERWGGGVTCFRNLDDPSKYASAEFALICVDELTKNIYNTFDQLRTRLRAPGLIDVECQFVAGTNPGSVGHGWVKQFWMDKVFPDEWMSPIDYRSQFAYVPSLADDNPYLDESYWNMLNTLPEALRKPFRYGDWNVFIGQAFSEFNQVHHVVKNPPQAPEGAPLYMTMDWGFGAPFSIGWWWVDNDGRVYRFMEWYGFTGTPNQGLRITDSQIAEGIVEREMKANLTGKPIIRIANPDAFNKKPDYRGGGQGKSTAEVFAGYKLYLTPGDPSRLLKIRQFRERLRVRPGESPMMMIYPGCVQFIRTIPSIVMDKNNIEDVDTTCEDHIYDEAALIAMARPLVISEPAEYTLPNPATVRVDTIESQPSVDAINELYGLLNGEEEEYAHYGVSTVE